MLNFLGKIISEGGKTKSRYLINTHVAQRDIHIYGTKTPMQWTNVIKKI